MKFLAIVFFILSLLVLISVYIPPVNFWPVGFITMGIPFVLLANLLLLIYLIYKKKWFFGIMPLLILVVGFRFLSITFNIKFKNSDEDPADFSVLSYNTSGLRLPNLYKDEFYPKGDELMAWIAENDADIKCLQEFYNNDRSPYWNSINKLSIGGQYNCYFSSDSVNHTTGRRGVAIFSKFPIINKGDILVSHNKFNRAAFADVKIGKDTIRVINVHLQSLEIKKAKPTSNSSLSDIVNDLILIYYRLKHGGMERSEQCATLINFIEKSPHKVILAGDFNEMPYCYVYNAVRSKLVNSFEKAGSGFGFTYNGKTLFFLRIDNLFYGDGIDIVDFKTHRDVELSEHFPIEGRYVIEGK